MKHEPEAGQPTPPSDPLDSSASAPYGRRDRSLRITLWGGRSHGGCQGSTPSRSPLLATLAPLGYATSGGVKGTPFGL